ncbi:MAG: transposase [Pseudomonadota bacterium]
MSIATSISTAPNRPSIARAATPSFLAKVLINIYADHRRLRRHSEILKRCSIKVDRSTLASWDGFTLFLGDGRIELNTNVLERVIGPLVLTRKNALFAGSERGAVHRAMASSTIEICRLNQIEPFAYLRGILERVVSRQTGPITSTN